jgi:hypothetical protein
LEIRYFGVGECVEGEGWYWGGKSKMVVGRVLS